MDWTAAKQHMLNEYPSEGVGYFTGDGVFHPLVNTSEVASAFEVDSSFLLNAPVLLVHSHLTQHHPAPLDPRTPSKEDMEYQEATNIEWAILVTDGETVDDPVFFGIPGSPNRPKLEGRPFIHSMYDCLELCRDYFAAKGIRLPQQPRDFDWFVKGEDYMSNLYETWGFRQVQLSDLKPGDVLFYKVKSPVVNHLAIFLGGEVVISHWFGRTSSKESIYDHINFITFAARYAPGPV